MSSWLISQILNLAHYSRSGRKNNNGIPMVERNPSTKIINEIKNKLVSLTGMKIMNAIADGDAEEDSCNFTLVGDEKQVIYQIVLFFNVKSRITDIALEYREGTDPRRARRILEKFCSKVEQRKIKAEYMGVVSKPHSNMGGL